MRPWTSSALEYQALWDGFEASRTRNPVDGVDYNQVSLRPISDGDNSRVTHMIGLFGAVVTGVSVKAEPEDTVDLLTN